MPIETTFGLPVSDPVLIVAIAMGIFLVAPFAAQLVRLPGIIGIILVGALVGPNALNLLDRDPTIVLLGTVGLLYLMFMAGIEIDLHGFRKHRNRSLTFGALTFLLPQVLGIGVGRALGYGWATSILMASMFASHTLVAYPVAMRLGIGKNRAVTPAVGGTIITDTAALLVLAVIAASTRGALDAGFWIRLCAFLGIYVIAVATLLPRMGRWLFRHEKAGANAEYLFILTALFVGAYFAEVAGVEAIVGAFLVGLVLNPLLPEGGLLTHRIHFVGEAIFIPFFLLSVGMLVDVRVFMAGPAAWLVMIGMTGAVMSTKFLAAWVFQKSAGFSRAEGWTVFGLTVPQAAATLAATLIGVEVGLFDEAVLNGAIAMILVTCVVGPAVVAKFGREIALEEKREPRVSLPTSRRIVAAVANPVHGAGLLELAMLLRDRDSHEPLHPLTVVPDDKARATAYVATAEKMLREASTYAAAAGVPVIPLTRVDHNFASGISRGAVETLASTILLGWDGDRSRTVRIFGTVVDQILEMTHQEVLVARIRSPLNTMRRIVLLIPEGSDRMQGFTAALELIKQLAQQLGTPLMALTIRTNPAPYVAYLEANGPDVPVLAQAVGDWDQLPPRLDREVAEDDLLILLGARRGAVAWTPELENLPKLLSERISGSLLAFYPSESQNPRSHPFLDLERSSADGGGSSSPSVTSAPPEGG